MKYIKLVLRFLFILLVATWAISFFVNSKLAEITNPSSATLNDPVQSAPTGPSEIIFNNNDYNYRLKPLYDYKISGIVVHKINYGFIYTGPDKTAPYDMCIVWGKNVSDKTYLSNQINFSQDQRFCFVSYRGNFQFHSNQFSNNHLVVNNEEVLQKLKSINIGDEISIKGKLVNMSATDNDDFSKKKVFTWNSSISREDTKNGACEVIYVESVSTISQAHPIATTISTYVPWAILAVITFRFFLSIYEFKKRPGGNIITLKKSK